jgi:hypothetical protein
MKYVEEHDTERQTSGNDDDKMGIDDKMNLWRRHMDDTDDGIDRPGDEYYPETIDDTYPEDIDVHFPELEAYRELINKIPAYQWLSESLRRELRLTSPEPSSLDTIRTEISNSLPSSRIVSRYDQPATYQVTFILKWDLIAFIREQEFETGSFGFLGKIITITGTNQDAQATTCLQYLNQTWHSYGTDILQLIESIVLTSHESEGQSKLTQMNCEVATEILYRYTARQHTASRLGTRCGI